MTMMQKVQAKKSKKGFTLVELVIVIAILAILAAIAIPVITTTINSSKLSVFDSDTATMNMLLKEWINTYKADITTTTYNGKIASSATVADICAANGLASGADYFTRVIGGDTYAMTWITKGSRGDGVLSVSKSGAPIAATDGITKFCVK